MNHNIHLWLTSVFLLVANSVMGAITATEEDQIPAPFTTQAIEKTDLAKFAGTEKKSTSATGLFANGHAIVIEDGTETDKIKVTTTDLPENVSVELPGATTIVFGGKYNDKCGTTNITLKSGKVYCIVGGGYGTTTENSADVTTSTINLDGGTVNMWVLGGGAYYSKTETANINAKGADSPTAKGWMIGCMESGAIKGNQYPEYEAAPCSVGEMNLDIQKGTYWIIALAGGNGDHTFTKTGIANIKGTQDSQVVIEGGLFGCGSNGRGKSAEATVEYCNLSKKGLELAAVNRGKLETVDFTFKNCTFSNEIYAYLGGTYKWQDGYTSSTVGVPTKVKFTFEPSCINIPSVGISQGLEKASVELNGAKGKIAVFNNGNKTDNLISSFAIGSGKTWTFNNGLEMTSEATLTGEGTLVVKGTYTVATAAQLETAIKQTGIDAIELSGNEYELKKPLALDKAITLSSANPESKATIKGYIAIQAEGVTVKDINLSYNRKSPLFNEKNGISVFANEATITGNTFTATEDGTNGIVFYPVGNSVEQKYTVTGNTFNLAGAGSTGIIVRENFKSNSQIPNVTTTASLSNGSALDQQIMATDSKNTYGSMTGGYYVRVTGNYSEADVTSGGSEAITQKYLYSYVGADGVADAIALSQMGATVNAPKVASSDLATKLNALDPKPAALASAVKILCLDVTVYTDLASALAAPAGSKYLAKNVQGSYELKTPEKATPTIADNDKPTASEIEVGQPLSASLLSGGIAKASEKNIPGVFSWANPDTKVEKTTGEYDVIFTPTNQTLYNVVKEIKVSVNATQYFTVTIGKCENGKVEITEGGNSANKYKANDKLTLKATPDKHYEFDTWTKGSDNYAVTENASLVATFKQIKHKVTFGDNITVLNAGTAIKTDAEVAEGSVLTVTAAQTGKELTGLTCNDQKIINNQVVVSGNVKIEATFADIKPTTRLVQVNYSSDNTKNGKVKLYDKSGNILESGSAVTIGEVVNIEAIPDYGYQVKESGLSVTNATLKENKFTVSENEGAITIKQEFEKKKFKVTLPKEETDYATVTLEGSPSLDAVEFGTTLTISTATASDGYKLVAIVVNGKEVAANKGTFTVTADTKVNAVTVKLPVIQFVDTKQTLTYNGAEQAFVVRTVPAGITGINLTYKQEGKAATPTDAGTYDVYVSYSGDEYAQLTEKEIGTLTINQAQYTAVAIPTQESNIKDKKETASDGEYYKVSDKDDNFQTVAYKLSSDLSKNFETPEFVIPKADADIATVTFTTQEKQTTPRSLVITKAPSSQTLTLIGVSGSIEVYNGPVKAKEGFDGQTVTLKAIPDAGYSSIPTWSGTNVTDNKDGTATILLGAGEVTATFKEKAAVEAPIETGKTLASTYNGATYGSETMDLSSVVKSKTTGWSLTIKQGGLTVDQPTDASSYDIVASRQEDEAYASTTKTIGTLNIAKAIPVLSEVAASEISITQSLNESNISGTSNVPGTFSWVNEQAQLKEGENTLDVKFTPDNNSNYEETTKKVTLKVNKLSDDVTVRTLSLVVNNPEMGSAVVMSLDNVVLEGNTATLGKDNKTLTVTFTPNNGNQAVATINGSSYTSDNNYSIPTEGNVEVVVTYSKIKEEENPGDGGEEQPDVTPVTGIKLDVTTKTLAIGESFTLKATIEPAGADNKKVSWSSSDPAVASVDKDGNVKALKAGTCKITVTTDDGDYTADCNVTVSTPTGIDEILTVNRIYTDYGLIIIEPQTSPAVVITDMTGRVIFNGLIAQKTQISVTGGFYLVRMAENGKAATTKVIVK